jgi:tRNA-specific adenosine deaminase 2
MLTTQRQESWMPFVSATAALGLALYYLRTRHPPPSSAPETSQVDQQPCQAPDPDDELYAMDPKQRAYHERFMREAIAMVELPHLAKCKYQTADSSPN